MLDRGSFLGRGFSFPPRVDSATGRFVLCEGEDDIRQSVYIILMTRKREYAMLPDFGCDLHEYVFGFPDETSLALARGAVIDALTDWEPRIVDITVGIGTEDLSQGKVVFDIGYTVRATNNPNNLVFPYYLYEGVGME